MFSYHSLASATLAMRRTIPAPHQLWDAINPVTMVRELVTLNRREHLLLGSMLTASVIAFAFQHDYSTIGWIGLLTSFATAFNLILVDRGRLTNYGWGLISTSTWLVIAFHNRLIGDISSQLFYFIAQFVGIAVWHRSIAASQNDAVIPRRLTNMMVIWAIGFSLLLYGANVMLSHALHGNQIYLDASLLVLGVIGQILMTYGYRSQWVAWLILDVINVIIWAVQLSHGGAAALSMLVLQISTLINGLYGAYLWFRPQTE